MERDIREFVGYLHNTKKTSHNTEISYQRDLKKMALFLEERGLKETGKVRRVDLEGYLDYMERENLAPSTISRSVASIRAFFQYMFTERRIESDPADRLKPPKVEKKAPQIMTVQEVDSFLAQPDVRTAKGIRDKAMLELMYATGMRVSELLHLNREDVNLSLGYVTCHESGKERVIPIGNVCRDALLLYMEEGRQAFVKEEEEQSLFTNCSGRPMSRQGFWKVLKGYAKSAGIQMDITPHTLRHSFAVHMLQNGADIKSVQEMLGHSDISTTQVYLNRSMNKIRDVYMKAHPRH
ncbi:MAG: site-specific tyrosine recombinase XerD [Eubacteriales bacterium]|nr:site-specific tyrosine recombinase XerD [Eubacteriales bacterium]